MRKKQRLPDKQEELLTKPAGRDVTDRALQNQGDPAEGGQALDQSKPAQRSWPPSSSSQQQHKIEFPGTMSLVCVLVLLIRILLLCPLRLNLVCQFALVLWLYKSHS